MKESQHTWQSRLFSAELAFKKPFPGFENLEEQIEKLFEYVMPEGVSPNKAHNKAKAEQCRDFAIAVQKFAQAKKLNEKVVLDLFKYWKLLKISGKTNLFFGFYKQKMLPDSPKESSLVSDSEVGEKRKGD